MSPTEKPRAIPIAIEVASWRCGAENIYLKYLGNGSWCLYGDLDGQEECEFSGGIPSIHCTA